MCFVLHFIFIFNIKMNKLTGRVTSMDFLKGAISNGALTDSLYSEMTHAVIRILHMMNVICKQCKDMWRETETGLMINSHIET